MTKTMIAILMTLGLPVLCAAQAPQCMFNNQFFTPGTVTCQGGTQFRCVGGAWKDIGTGCAAEDTHQSGVRVQPGVNEPTVRDPSVRGPGAVKQQPGVVQPPVQ